MTDFLQSGLIYLAWAAILYAAVQVRIDSKKLVTLLDKLADLSEAKRVRERLEDLTDRFETIRLDATELKGDIGRLESSLRAHMRRESQYRATDQREELLRQLVEQEQSPHYEVSQEEEDDETRARRILKQLGNRTSAG